jgi:TolA-binding protein
MPPSQTSGEFNNLIVDWLTRLDKKIDDLNKNVSEMSGQLKTIAIKQADIEEDIEDIRIKVKQHSESIKKHDETALIKKENPAFNSILWLIFAGALGSIATAIGNFIVNGGLKP